MNVMRGLLRSRVGLTSSRCTSLHPASTVHVPYVRPPSTVHVPYVRPPSTVHVPYVRPPSTVHLPYVRLASAVHVRYVHRMRSASAVPLWPSMKQWPNLSTTGEQTIVDEVNRDSVNDIFKMLVNQSHGPPFANNVDRLRFICRQLAFTQYVMCEQDYPYKAWLKKDIDLAFTQLYPSALRHAMEPVVQDSRFSQLLNSVDKSLNNIECENLNEIMKSLLYLGEDKHSLLLRKMYFKARSEMCYVNWTGISDLLQVATVMGASDYRLYCDVLKRMKNDLRSGITSTDHQEMLGFVKALNTLPSLFSDSLCETLSKELNRIFADHEFINSPYNVAAWMKAATAIYDTANVHVQIELEQSFLKLHEITSNLNGQFSILEIGEILRNMGLKYPSIAPPLFSWYDYVDKMTCDVMEVKDLMVCAAFCLAQGETEPLGKLVREQLLVQLKRHVPDDLWIELVDYELIFTINSQGGMSGPLRDLLRDLLSKGLKLVLELGIEKLFITFEKRPRHRDLLHNRALDMLKNAVSCKEVLFLSSYVLMNSSQLASQTVTDRLLRTLQNSNIACWTLVLKCLKAYDINIKTNNSDIDTLKRTAYASIMNVIEDNTRCTFIELSTLLHESLGIRGLRRQDKERLIENIFYEIEKRVQYSTTYAMEEMVVKDIMRSDYFSPELLDALVKHVMMNRSQVETLQTGRIANALACCGKFGYVPKDIMTFQSIILEAFTNATSKQQSDVCVDLLNGLSSLDIYPEKELKFLFSDENMRTLPKFLVDKDQSQIDDVRRHFACLNINAALAVPELGLPHAPEGRTQKYTEEDSPHHVNNRIYELLARRFGEHCVNRDLRSKFNIFIPIEIGMNQLGRPLPVAEERYTFDSDARRIAVIPIAIGAMALNRNILMCDKLMQVRNLNRAGHDVILILHNNWHKQENERIKTLLKTIYDGRERNALPVIMRANARKF